MFAQWFRLLLCYLFGVLESLKHGEVRFFFVLFCYCQSPVVRTNSKQWAVASLTNIKKGPFRCCMPPPVAIYALMRRPKTELYHEFGKQTRNESEWSRRQNTYKHDIHFTEIHTKHVGYGQFAIGAGVIISNARTPNTHTHIDTGYRQIHVEIIYGIQLKFRILNNENRKEYGESRCKREKHQQ